MFPNANGKSDFIERDFLKLPEIYSPREYKGSRGTVVWEAAVPFINFTLNLSLSRKLTLKCL